jgi:tRNA threonylcarbamoyladenosine biosynthesis protein TsaB
MTWILHLETATKVCSVALSKDGELVIFREEVSEQYTHAENLTLFVQSAMDEAGITLPELSAISVSSGPGSYTGLRIGVATAKGFCYALNIPLIVIDSLFSMAVLASLKYPGKILCPVIDARRMEVYNAIYDESLNVLKTISADIVNAETYSEFEPFVCFGDAQSKLQTIWAHRNVHFDETIHASARGQVNEAYLKFNRESFEDVAYFEPFYLKDFKTK